MFYAIHHPYGTETMSSADRLHRFVTKAERDEMADEQWDGSNYHWETVTRAEARRLFPRAFQDLDWTNPNPEDEIWEDDEWQASPTGGSYEYM